MTEPRAVDIVARAGAYNTLDADKVRRLEDRVETWVAENDYEEDNFLRQIRLLLSEQIAALEIRDGYRVVANGRLYRVTNQNGERP